MELHDDLNPGDVIAPVARTREEAERMDDELERLILLGNVRRARRLSQVWYARSLRPTTSTCAARPRERRPRRRSTVRRARARSPGRLGDDDPEPALAAIPPEEFWREVDAWRSAA